ncbi:hypothetical protein [Serratia sp. M24T3]|uniref:hypothetical protein n=1 Tax=Serratia sp. M24T3 TaxID=932213 RepID=UPI00025B915C|nr:hypothetical protein [Serratia sp. M24T3]EIC84028.1 hypothetical protein SPM24T3_13965 [Serratia sp. M24T3]
MTTFAISTSDKNDKLNSKLISLYGTQNFLLVDDFLRIVISDKDVTSEDVFKKLNHQGDVDGKLVIFAVNSYFGFHNKTTWEWLKARGV